MTAAVDSRLTLELSEYQIRRVPAPAPTDVDRRLADRLAKGVDGVRLDVRWLAGGDLEVRASSHIGVVRFSGVDVRIVPKLAGGVLRVLQMLGYATGIDMLRHLPTNRPLPANGTDLFDLIGLLLNQEAERLIRDGLNRDYRTTDDSLQLLRGRLRYRDQLLRRFGQLDRVECNFDEYDSDVPVNQLVAAALNVARRCVQQPSIRSQSGRLAAIFGEACSPTPQSIESYEHAIRYDRRNDRYRPAHELAKLILRRRGFDDLYDMSGRNVSAFLIDMNSVFEQFITRLVTEALHRTELRVTPQQRLTAVVRNDVTGRPHSVLKPDLVITDPGSKRSVPIDVKYKTYDSRKISTADIYQSFLYAYALGGDDREPRVGIIYPAQSPVNGPRLSVSPGGGRVAARIIGSGIDLPAALDDLRLGRKGLLLQQVRTSIEATTGFLAADLV